MNQAISRMLDRYPSSHVADRELALREILQELILVGLNRSDFFQHAAFYGGTALRIFYGLDRFSEDLDFTLTSTEKMFSWLHYAKYIEDELASFGFTVNVSEKEKTKKSAIKSAFLKANTFQELLKVGIPQADLHGFHPNTTIRIKVEIDTKPHVKFHTEERYLREPIPVSICCLTEECLFAGKMHATLFRQWRDRVKGHDWYDMIWFIRRKVPLNLSILSQIIGKTTTLTPEMFLNIAKERVSKLNIDSAKSDIRVFIKDSRDINSWNKDFFLFWLKQITFSEI